MSSSLPHPTPSAHVLPPGILSLEELLQEVSLVHPGGATRFVASVAGHTFDGVVAEGLVVFLLEVTAPFSPGEFFTGVTIEYPSGAPFLYHLVAEAALLAEGTTTEEEVRRLYRQQSVAAGALLERLLLFAGEELHAHAEALPEELLSRLSSWDFLRLSPAAYRKEVVLYLREEAFLAEDLGVDVSPWSSWGVESLGEEVMAVKEGAAGLLHVAALTEESLQEIAEGTSLTSLEILQALQAEVKGERLRLVPLPASFETSSLDGSSASAWSLSSLEEEVVPEDVLQGEDPLEAAAQEELMKLMAAYRGTPALSLEIEADAKVVMARYISQDALKFRLFEYLLQNASLVGRVKALEGELRPLTVRYQRDVALLEEMRLEHSFADAGEGDAAEVVASSVADDATFVAKRQEVNTAHFAIRRLEEDRASLNEERRAVLEGLAAVLPLREEDEESQRLHETISLKLAGIDEVENVVFVADAHVKGRASAIRSSSFQGLRLPQGEEETRG